jgi:hypothetical protein
MRGHILTARVSGRNPDAGHISHLLSVLGFWPGPTKRKRSGVRLPDPWRAGYLLSEEFDQQPNPGNARALGDDQHA